MAAPRPPDQRVEWMENGFPPRSFPVEPPRHRGASPAPRVHGGAITGRPAGRSRGRLIAALAVLIALLVLAAGLWLARRGDDGTDAVTVGGTSTTAPETSILDNEPSTSMPTTSSIEPVLTPSTGASSTSIAGPASGVLETSVSALSLAKVDASNGPQVGRVTLRNTGAAPLAYTTQSSSAAVTATPPRGTIAPGASADLAVTIDASKVPTEGPFSGTLTVGGTGGTKAVQVTATVGRAPRVIDDAGEACAARSASCSRQIKVAPSPDAGATPCDTPWLYSVTITDQSRIQSAKVVARQGLANADSPLLPSGSGIYQSTPFAPLPQGSGLRFMVEAVDQYGFATRLPEQTISC